MNILFWRFWEWMALVAGLGVSALAIYLLARWSWRWVLVLVLALGALLFLGLLPWRVPASSFLDPDLPPLFLNHFWAWVLAFLLAIGFSMAFLIRALRAARPAGRAEASPAELAGRFPDLESAWEEVLVALGQAQIDPSGQHVFLVLAPTEESAAALVHSAGLPLFAEAPATSAPIHAYASGDGLILSASGASAFGVQDVSGSQRLERLCHLLGAQRPDCPVVRGVVVVFPISWAGQPESIKWAAALRDDLRTIQRTLKVRCPVFALFTEMESVPGFTEFARRMPPALRQGRCGFAVPRSQAFTGDLVQRGLAWVSGWFRGWTLNLMSGDLFNHAGNNQLFSLDNEVRRYRKRMRAVLEAAFSTHRDGEPVLFRGCYFAASGASTGEQAFSPGLIRGPRSRVIADQLAAHWTRQAEEDDRHYRRLALAVGAVGGVLSLLAWVYLLVQADNPWWWAGPVVLAIGWVVTLLKLRRW